MKVFVNPGHDPAVDSGAVNSDYDVREADVTKQAGALLEAIEGKILPGIAAIRGDK